MKPWQLFLLGSLAGPLVLGFGKLIIFVIGCATVVWVAYTVHAISVEDTEARTPGKEGGRVD